MVVLYTSTGCASCRKTKQWLKHNNIEFIEKNIFNVLLNDLTIIDLISSCDNGLNDIISQQAKVLIEAKIDLETMSQQQVIHLIRRNPSIVKRPIIIIDEGFNQVNNENNVSKSELAHLRNKCDKECTNYYLCGAIREE